MIVCSCNVASSGRLCAAARRLREEGDEGELTPARLFRCMGGRMECGRCSALVKACISADPELGPPAVAAAAAAPDAL